MSDFLARLALRATDTAAAVHPRPLGRFEPAAEPRAAIGHDAGDAPASWPTPPRRPENAPAVAQPLAPLPRPSATPPAVRLAAPLSVAPRTPPTVAADPSPPRRTPPARPPAPIPERPHTPAPPAVVFSPPPAVVRPPSAAPHPLRDLLPRAVHPAPLADRPTDARPALPGERSPAARPADGRPGPRPTALPGVPFVAPRLTLVAGDTTAQQPPRPMGQFPTRPPAAPAFLTASPTVAPSVPPAILAQLRAAVHPGPDERPLPTAQPPAPVPVVHVHIGRVEVRAAPPPRPSAPARPAPPLPTVDDYLRRRNGERS